MRIQTFITYAFLVVSAITTVNAQTQSSGSQTPRVDRRQANQSQRIEQGIASGQLTAREATRLQREQSRIQKTEDKAKADGVVTGKEKAVLHAEQDRASRVIRRNRHDRQVSAPTAKP